MAAPEAIRVEGLRDLQSDLRKANDKLPRQLRLASKEAVDLVRDRARSLALAQGGVAAKAAPAIASRPEQRGGSVRIDGAGKYKWALGAEFGGGTHGPGRPTAAGGYTTQFKPHRGSGAEAGYFLYPTIRRSRPDVIERYFLALGDVLDPVFPD